MEFALVVRKLLRHRLLLVVGVLLAAIVAILSVYRIEGSKLKSRSLQYSSASTQILVDTPSSVLGNVSQSFESLNMRAQVYAGFMVSPAILELIGHQVGLLGGQIYATGPVDLNQPPVVVEPTALKRNVEITGEAKPYRLNFESQPNQPTINIFSQAPTTTQAVALANAAASGLQLYVTRLQNAQKIPPRARVAIRQLGSATGAVVNGGVSKALMVIVFLAVFLFWCVLILLGGRLRENWRASALLQSEIDSRKFAEDRDGDVDTAEKAAVGDSGVYMQELPPLETSGAEDRTAVPTHAAR
jgi:capsular polysaccharide biosynthesis protein